MSVQGVLYRGDLMVVKYHCGTVSPHRVLAEEILLKLMGGDRFRFPEGLQTLLRQSYISPKSLAPFGRIEKQVRDYLSVRSTGSPLGNVLNPGKAGEVALKFAEFKDAYLAERPKFLEAYEKMCKKREGEIKAGFKGLPYADTLLQAIRESRPTAARLEEALTMDYWMFHVGEISANFDAAADKAVRSGVVSLRRDLPGLVCQEAARFYGGMAREIGDRAEIRQSTVRVAVDGADRLYAMAFISPGVNKLADQVSCGLKVFQHSGPLRAVERDAFMGALSQLGDQRHLFRAYELGIPPIDLAAITPKGQTELMMKHPSDDAQETTIELPTAPTGIPVPIVQRPAVAVTFG